MAWLSVNIVVFGLALLSTGLGAPASTTSLSGCAEAGDLALFDFDFAMPSVLKHSTTGLCVDAALSEVDNSLQLGGCTGASKWEVAGPHLSTIAFYPCRVATHGVDCKRCLDLYDGKTDGPVDGFDCKNSSNTEQLNQEWTVTASGSTGQVRISPQKASSQCLVASAGPPAPPAPAIETIVVDASATGREYYGVGGLSNSDAPWLPDYPEPERSAILDALFLPHHVASLQILKVEIGGDGSSTIVTESSHMHDSDPNHASYQRGWEWWLLKEALARNPSIKTAALAWTAPGWLEDYYSNATIDYLVNFLKGARDEHGVTFDFMGMRNESPNPPAPWIVWFRAAMNAAGFSDTVMFGSDNHDFSIVDVIDSDPAAFDALGILGVHEPLRDAESVPAAATATGKPIWASEAYTTYSDMNGAGCWARVSNWGPVLGNVSAQIAWNLIQSYPGAAGYTGHGLMWAEEPWSGNFVINPPLWASAHYTQFTESGWRYLRNGLGSGMLESGGSYVTVVPGMTSGKPNGTFATIIQAMTWNNSQCFKDNHPAYTVATAQTVEVRLTGTLLQPAGGALQLWKSCFVAGDDPINPTQSTLFERQSPDPVISSNNSVMIQVHSDCVYTLASQEPVSQAAKHGDVGPIPASQPFPDHWCSDLNVTVDSHAPFMLDQNGVFEGAVQPEDGSVALTQAAPMPSISWHSDATPHPLTFFGANRTANLTVSCEVKLPQSSVATTFAGIGVALPRSFRSAIAPSSLVIFANGTACFSGSDSTLPCKQAANVTPGTWSLLQLESSEGVAKAIVNGVTVFSDVDVPVTNPSASWPGLVSSFDAAAFRNLCITTNA